MKNLFKFQKENRDNPTASELHISKLLQTLKIKYIAQKGFMNGEYFYLIDFYLPRPRKLCIEVDGGSHDNVKQKFRDNFKDIYLTNRKLKILRLPAKTALKISPAELKNLIDIYTR